jgi:CIC family chloride channel protein
VVLVLVGDAVADERLMLGSGYAVIHWLTDTDHAVGVLAVVLFARCLATSAVVAGGGSGGLFVPLVVAGALTGRITGEVVQSLDAPLFTVVGVAAFLGAGYRVPLAAVMFVAESTGRPGFVVPGLLAAVAAELVVGDASVTAYQRRPRVIPPPASVEGV